MRNKLHQKQFVYSGIIKERKVMLVFKENVKGFIYDSIDGSIVKIFDGELNEDKIELINEIIDEDSILISNEETLNELFEISKESLFGDHELINVVDFKD